MSAKDYATPWQANAVLEICHYPVIVDVEFLDERYDKASGIILTPILPIYIDLTS